MPNQYLEQEKEINNNNISKYIMHYLSKSHRQQVTRKRMLNVIFLYSRVINPLHFNFLNNKLSGR